MVQGEPEQQSHLVIARFTPQEIERRFVHVATQCASFIGEWSQHYPGSNLSVDLVVMKNVAQSAMDDIWRYKAYHLIDPRKLSDSVKRAAYFTKWLVKLRPIFFNRPVEADKFEAEFNLEDDSLLVNEAFALHFAFATMGDVGEHPHCTLAPAVMRQMLYDLHFRHVNDDMLLSFFQVVREIALGNPIITT